MKTKNERTIEAAIGIIFSSVLLLIVISDYSNGTVGARGIIHNKVDEPLIFWFYIIGLSTLSFICFLHACYCLYDVYIKRLKD